MAQKYDFGLFIKKIFILKAKTYKFLKDYK